MSKYIPSEIKTGTDLANRKILISCNDVVKYKTLIERLTSEVALLVEVVQIQNDALRQLRNELELRRIQSD
jgi:hypothetical protein